MHKDWEKIHLCSMIYFLKTQKDVDWNVIEELEFMSAFMKKHNITYISENGVW